MPEPRLSVIVATREWPEALDLVLLALSEQRGPPFEIVVADDGSGTKTSGVVDSWRERLELRHVWQPHDGFRKARLLNLAALSATGSYLLFLDGDCLPRPGLVEGVRRSAHAGWFVAGKRLHLSPSLTKRVLAGAAPVWRWSLHQWLLAAPRELVSSPHRQANRPGVLFPVRDRARPWRPGSADYRPPYNGYGYLFGVARADFEHANGFDMRFGGWDAEDTDLARRLRRAGLRCGWPGPDASVLHLWHSPGKQPAKRLPDDPDRIDARIGLRELTLELGAQESA